MHLVLLLNKTRGIVVIKVQRTGVVKINFSLPLNETERREASTYQSLHNFAMNENYWNFARKSYQIAKHESTFFDNKLLCKELETFWHLRHTHELSKWRP
jgi:hypothetical protein